MCAWPGDRRSLLASALATSTALAACPAPTHTRPFWPTASSNVSAPPSAASTWRARRRVSLQAGECRAAAWATEPAQSQRRACLARYGPQTRGSTTQASAPRRSLHSMSSNARSMRSRELGAAPCYAQGGARTGGGGLASSCRTSALLQVTTTPSCSGPNPAACMRVAGHSALHSPTRH